MGDDIHNIRFKSPFQEEFQVRADGGEGWNIHDYVMTWKKGLAHYW